MARILNEFFVAIKVDREERPDVDNVYMTACQAMTGSGGWPLTILMTADRKPFFAGTYFPKNTSFGRTGLVELLENARKVWEEQRSEVHESADRITEALNSMTTVEPGPLLPASVQESAFLKLKEAFDKRFGGFGSAPKFPIPHQLVFLLRYGHQRKETEAMTMAARTLAAIRRGGIYDHLGFGVHRYSTDREFLLPHFEKMLYDQALLSLAYVEAYQALGEEEFRNTAEEIFSYVLRDMTSPDGGFYSAEDADSEGEEGKFYVWHDKELHDVIGGPHTDAFIRRMNVLPEGNYREEATGQKTGRNILHLNPDTSDVTMDARIRKTLFETRKRREHPLKDDKVLASWNGLMIAALARGGRIFERPEYIDAARKAAGFVLGRMSENGHLLRRFRDGQAALPAYLDDYAFVVWGLIELYEADFDKDLLLRAVELTDTMVRSFWDERGGGFLFSGDRNEQLLAPFKPIYDGALPSGNSVALWNMTRLGRMIAREDYTDKVDKAIRVFSTQVAESPHAFSMFLVGLSHHYGPSREVVVVGKRNADDTRRILNVMNRKYLPNHSVIFKEADTSGTIPIPGAEYLRYYEMKDGKATAYVCENFACRNPATDPADLSSLLDQ